MRHWSQLGIRNWRVKKGRTAGALAAIALGVGVVVWVTCAYESVRLALQDQVWFWIGRSHLSVESMYGMYGSIPQQIAEEVAADPNVAAVTARVKHGMKLFTLQGAPTRPAAAATRPAPGDAVPSVREQVLSLVGPASRPVVDSNGVAIEAVGIDPVTEEAFRPYDERSITGRMLRPGDTDAIVVDRDMAEALGIGLGDRILLQNVTTGVTAPVQERQGIFEVAGLIDMRRVAKKQKPVAIAMLGPIQQLTGKDSPSPEVTRIDMILKDSSVGALASTTARVRSLVAREYRAARAVVSSAQAKLKQIEAAERQTQFVLLIISTVALFTAFFVILSTLSMGMIERIGQLGLMRCLGVTRGQVAALVLAEALPLGMVGILLGIPVGFGLARLSVVIAREYIGQFAISELGLLLAVAGGLLTTLLGALIPMVQAMRVSPLAASRPQARQPSRLYIWLAAVLGAVMIGVHAWMLAEIPAQSWFRQPLYAVMSVGLLYGGYALVAPALVLIVGQAAVHVAAVVLRIRHRLLSDQVGRAAWRSAAICSGLMVGLSLVVSISVYSESLAKGWDFPKDFCEAFVYISPPVPYAVADQARQTPGVAESCLVNEKLQTTVRGKSFFDFGLAYFVAGEPQEFFNIARLEFVQGDQQTAIAKLEQGGHVLITPEFSRAHRVDLGDPVRVTAVGRSATFHVAGVVTSPALDIAANFFNAGEALTLASYTVVLGTLQDLEKYFRVPREASMFLLNFDLPPTPPPPAFTEDEPPTMRDASATARLILSWAASLPHRTEQIEEITAELRRAEAAGRGLNWSDSMALRLFRDALVERQGDWDKLEPAQRWRSYREELVMRVVAAKVGTTPEKAGSVAALKARIDSELRRATVLFTSIPMVALIVAALGVGNLMMANVTSRARQIAMLRAIGATRWQVMRLVVGEAVVLGTLGCLLGLGLGLHAAHGMNVMTESIWGYRPNWTVPTDLVGMGIAFTLLVCLGAGLIPARHAARNNIIDAMQTT